MIKWMILAVIIGVALVDYALLIACSRMENREAYEAYERWKKEHERKKDELVE